MKRMRRAVAVVAVFAVVAVSSVALAEWLANGSGSGRASAITARALSVTGASGGAGLYPGGTGDVSLTISNPNPYAVSIASVTGSGAITSDKGAACDASTGVTFANQSGLALMVPAASGGTAGSATFTLAGAASMSNASHDSCQGAQFTIPVTVSGASTVPTTTTTAPTSTELVVTGSPGANNLFFYENYEAGQSFTVPSGSTMTAVEFFVTADSTPAQANVVLKVWDGDPGASAVVRQVTFPAKSFTPGQWLRFDLAPVGLGDGTFAVTLDHDNAGAAPRLATVSGYAGGSLWNKSGTGSWTAGNDFVAKVFGY